MKPTFIIDKFNLNLEKPKDCVNVSYSQYSTFAKCSLKWKLSYIDKIKIKSDSIHTIFGDSMHNVIQNWIKVMHTESIKNSNAIDFKTELMKYMKQSYAEAVQKNGGTHFSTKEELTEFYMDGVDILEWLRKKRKLYFSSKDDILVGIEVPIMISPDESKKNVMMQGYLDLVIMSKRTGKIKIVDFKTSGWGWRDRDKKDQTKVNQLLLYKVFFAKQYDFPIENISVEYMILKRKINQDSLYAQRRVQIFEPSQGNVSYNKAMKSLQQFLDSVFLPDGSFNMLYDYRPTCGEYEFNCRFCEFRSMHDLCPPTQRSVI